MADTVIPSADQVTTASNQGGIDWASALGGLSNLGFGLNTLFGNNALSAGGNYAQAAAAADPFAGQRGQYQNMLSQLMTNPSSFNLSPAAQAQMQMGTENLQRSAAAQGFLGSGNILGELQKYGQNVASQDYYNQANLLSGLAGAQSGSPATAGAILGDLYGARQLGQTQVGTGLNTLFGSTGSGTGSLGGSLLSSILGAGGSALSGLFGGSSGTSGFDWSKLFGSGTTGSDSLSTTDTTDYSNILDQLF